MLLAKKEELDIIKTFECGQCFRWNSRDGVYRGIAFGYPALVYEEDGNVFLESQGDMDRWRNYFDLDTDYTDYEKGWDKYPYLRECMDFSRGIRILRQDPWEALCSFIISQCNNIKRIKGIVERLCLEYGDETEFEGEIYRTFPTPAVLAGLEPRDLEVLRAGYRVPYIIDAARAVEEGTIDLEALKSVPYRDAKAELLKCNGIGEKVANCAVLFGLHHMEAFPVDVWMKRALNEHFPEDFSPDSLGPMAGLAQQYIFYYTRETALK